MKTLVPITLCSEIELRNRFQQRLNACQQGQRGWLLKGDVDHLKAFNDVYGKDIVNRLLDWAIDLVSETIAAFQTTYHLSGIDLAVSGDEMTVAISPATLTEDDIQALLDQINHAVAQYFTNRFVVAWVKQCDQSFRNFPRLDFPQLKDRLEQSALFLDPIPCQRGYRVLLPLLTAAEPLPDALTRIRQILQNVLPVRITDIIEAGFDWLYSPHSGAFESFQQGIVCPLTITWGAVTDDLLKSDVPDRLFTQLSRICQYNVQFAKTHKTSCAVNVPLPEKPLASGTSNDITLPVIDLARSRLPVASERYLHQVLAPQITKDLQGTLLKLEPVYRLDSIAGAQIACNHAEWRGNRHGIGIKGVNTLCGHEIGSHVITRLLFSISDALCEFCRSHQFSEELLQVALFVDTFTVYFRSMRLTSETIVRLADRIVQRFNASLAGLNLSHLTMSMVRKRKDTTGCTLFHRLELTARAEHSAAILHQSDSLLIKAYHPKVVQEAQQIMAMQAYQSATFLLQRVLSNPSK